jgi:hypothetical protein
MSSAAFPFVLNDFRITHFPNTNKTVSSHLTAPSMIFHSVRYLTEHGVASGHYVCITFWRQQLKFVARSFVIVSDGIRILPQACQSNSGILL